MNVVLNGHAQIVVGTEVIKGRIWEKLDVMKSGEARGWTQRAFNAALKSAKRDVIVSARLDLEMRRPPYTSLRGSLSGVNGKTLAKRGCFEP